MEFKVEKNNILNKFKNACANVLFKNSCWGIISHLSQTVFVSVFFIIVARKYSTIEFADYIIAITLYQLIAAFSTLGLSQWFVREIASTSNRKELIGKFFKIQICIGVIFYFINILFAFAIYDEKTIHILAVLFGINIIFDNLINAIKCLNIADYEQNKTFIILTVEAFLKVATGCLLFVYPFTLVELSVILLCIRFVTLNLFLKFGSSSMVDLKTIWNYEISVFNMKQIVILNWPFIIIGSVSMVNWRIANIIISKTLAVTDIANYEISYKIFSVAQLLPVIVSASIFPLLIKLYNERNMIKFSEFYQKTHLYYLLFGLLSYTFIYSFSDLFIPLAFGTKYSSTSMYTKQMFCTILVFPTLFLQANVLIAMKFEKYDMWFNIVALISNVSISLMGLKYVRSLEVVNVAIFIAFIIFHILQDILLVRIKVTSTKKVLAFHALSIVSALGYVGLSETTNRYLLFTLYWAVIACVMVNLEKIKLVGKVFGKKIQLDSIT